MRAVDGESGLGLEPSSCKCPGLDAYTPRGERKWGEAVRALKKARLLWNKDSANGPSSLKALLNYINCLMDDGQYGGDAEVIAMTLADFREEPDALSAVFALMSY